MEAKTVNTDHRQKIMVLLLCVFMTGTEEKEVTRVEVRGHDGDEKRLTFPPTAHDADITSFRGDVYIYKLQNLDALQSTVAQYIRLTFTVFNLPKGQAVLKIYDGADTNGPMTIFTGNDRPFYQSLQPQVYMVLKFYDVTKHHKPPEFDGVVTFTHEHRSLWVKRYPPGDGLGWRNRFLPTTTYCKQVQRLKGGGSGGCVAHPADRYPHDCYWRLHLGKEVKLVLGWDRLSDSMLNAFTVTTDGQSEFAKLSTKSLEPQLIKRELGRRPRVLMVFTGSTFHIHLFSFLHKSDLAFGYHEDLDTAIDLLEWELERKVLPDCPFKRCANGSCVLPWEACQDRYNGTDASCDKALSPLVDSRCGTQCYNGEWDACDTIKDCCGGQDERCTKHNNREETQPRKNENREEKERQNKENSKGIQLMTKDSEPDEKEDEMPAGYTAIIVCVGLIAFCIGAGCLAKSCRNLCCNFVCKCCSCLKNSCCELMEGCYESCGHHCCGRVQNWCQECRNCCQNRCCSCSCCGHHRQQPPTDHAPDEIDPGTPPPVYETAWTTNLPAVIYTAPENPPVSNIEHTDIEPPSYTDAVASVPDLPSSQAGQAPTGSPGAITRQPGRETNFRAPMLEGDAPPPSYSTVAPSVPSTRTDTSPGRVGTVRPVGYRQPDRARPTDQSTNRLRQGNTSEPPPSYDSVWS